MERATKRLVFLTLGWIFFAIGFIGIAIPGLPTTPLMILALGCFSKGSETLHHWLYNHPRFGPPLVAWRNEKAVSPLSKASALVLMSMSWGLLYFSGAKDFVLIVVGVTFVCVLTYLFSLPHPKKQ